MKKLLVFSVRFVLAFIAFAALYLLAAITLPFITVNNSFRQNRQGVKIFVLSNGVHTDFIMPVVSPLKDWKEHFSPSLFNAEHPAYSYIGIGWGDKGFYMDTPTWADLKFSTAFNAVFWLSSTAMHVTYYKQPDPTGERCAELIIDDATYRKLIDYIENSFQKKNGEFIYIDHPGYGRHDHFYEANGTYSLFNTCNNWTNRGLRQAGIKTALWSPFAKGLMRPLKRDF